MIEMKLVAEKLCARRGGRILFTDLSFVVDAGTALLITGPNGAGKTTLLRTLAGFLPIEAGSVRLDGGGAEMSLAEQCHYVGHANALKPTLTVAENAAFWTGFLGDAADRLTLALDTFGLAGLRDIPTGYLSAGQRRRAGLVRLLLARRPLWLLDEPTSSLDDAAQEMLAGVVNRHLAAGGLVVAATHLPLAFDRARELSLRSAAKAAA